MPNHLCSLYWGFYQVCDPVMGDDGKLYVPTELVAIYREKVSNPIMGYCVCKLILCSHVYK